MPERPRIAYHSGCDFESAMGRMQAIEKRYNFAGRWTLTRAAGVYRIPALLWRQPAKRLRGISIYAHKKVLILSKLPIFAAYIMEL